MLKKLYAALEKLENHKKLIEFIKKNKDAYFVSAFFMSNDIGAKDAEWQIDYYSPEKHKITSFAFSKGSVDVKEDQEVFQKNHAELKELKLDKVKIDFDKAIGIIEELRKKKYPAERANKIIVLLQDIDGGCLWNITYLTTSFNIWNVKVDAVDGKIKSEKLESVIQFKKAQ